MAAGFEFNIDGLEELERDLTKAIRRCPEYAGETLTGLAKEFRASATKRAKTELKHVKRKKDGKKWAIGRNWGHKLVGDSVGMAALVWNKAPHFHLVENGHNLVRNGQTVGFVPGKHIMEKTRNEYQDVIPERFQKMVDEILEECDLD